MLQHLFPVFIVVAIGSSMYPSIRTPAVAIVERGCSDVEVGDIVVVEYPGFKIMHRVISTNPLITKGDANTVADPPGGRCLGRVTHVIQSPASLLVLVPGALTLALAVAHVSYVITQQIRYSINWLLRRIRSS